MEQPEPSVFGTTAEEIFCSAEDFLRAQKILDNVPGAFEPKRTEPNEDLVYALSSDPFFAEAHPRRTALIVRMARRLANKIGLDLGFVGSAEMLLSCLSQHSQYAQMAFRVDEIVQGKSVPTMNVEREEHITMSGVLAGLEGEERAFSQLYLAVCFPDDEFWHR